MTPLSAMATFVIDYFKVCGTKKDRFLLDVLTPAIASGNAGPWLQANSPWGSNQLTASLPKFDTSVGVALAQWPHVEVIKLFAAWLIYIVQHDDAGDRHVELLVPPESTDALQLNAAIRDNIFSVTISGPPGSVSNSP